SSTLTYDPAPDTQRGFSAQLGYRLGDGSSGASLLEAQSFSDVAEGVSSGDSSSWDGEMAYGLRHGRNIGSVYARLRGRKSRLGYRLEPEGARSRDWNMGFWAQPSHGGASEAQLGVDVQIRW
ncbi:MAG: hypothetical protein GDA40_11610, partial [Rhodobacteraceae bacterium]|nr:hypothetical protein [Paracoccaceae bacterium]